MIDVNKMSLSAYQLAMVGRVSHLRDQRVSGLRTCFHLLRECPDLLVFPVDALVLLQNRVRLDLGLLYELLYFPF